MMPDWCFSQLQLQGGLSATAVPCLCTFPFIIAPEGGAFQTKTEVSCYVVLRLASSEECRDDLYHSVPLRNVLVSGPVGSKERMAPNKAVFEFELGDWNPYEYLRASIVLG